MARCTICSYKVFPNRLQIWDETLYSSSIEKTRQKSAFSSRDRLRGRRHLQVFYDIRKLSEIGSFPFWQQTRDILRRYMAWISAKYGDSECHKRRRKCCSASSDRGLKWQMLGMLGHHISLIATSFNNNRQPLPMWLRHGRPTCESQSGCESRIRATCVSTRVHCENSYHAFSCNFNGILHVTK